jgi:hypothetical protein
MESIKPQSGRNTPALVSWIVFQSRAPHPPPRHPISSSPLPSALFPLPSSLRPTFLPAARFQATAGNAVKDFEIAACRM